MTDIQVKCFLALARHLNFTQAAREMCISQSTLSMHISALEKNLNLTLFIRTKRKVELSPEGQLLFPKPQYMDNLLEETIAEARNLHKSHANILRIGYINGMSPDKILVPILGSFRETYPEVKVELKRSDHNILVEETAQNMLDAVFAHEQSLQMNSAFTGRIVFESPLCVMSARGRFETDMDRLLENEFKKETFIIMSEDTNSLDTICLKQFCEKYDIEMPETKNVNSIEAQLFNVEMGNGICLSDYSSRVFGDGRYDFWELPDMISRCCVIARKDNPNPVVKAFLNFVGNRVVN